MTAMLDLADAPTASPQDRTPQESAAAGVQVVLLDSGQAGLRLLPTWPVTTSATSPASTSSHGTVGMLASGIVTRAVGIAGTIAAPLARNHAIRAAGGIATAKTWRACEEQTRLSK